MIGANIRVGQDISFPTQNVFPRDPSFDAQNRARILRRRAVRPYGDPGARVVGPELGDVSDTIGGGSEVLGPDQIPGFPGGATPRAAFTPPPPFPEQPAPPPRTSSLEPWLWGNWVSAPPGRPVDRPDDCRSPRNLRRDIPERRSGLPRPARWRTHGPR